MRLLYLTCWHWEGAVHTQSWYCQSRPAPTLMMNQFSSAMSPGDDFWWLHNLPGHLLSLFHVVLHWEKKNLKINWWDNILIFSISKRISKSSHSVVFMLSTASQFSGFQYNHSFLAATKGAHRDGWSYFPSPPGFTWCRNHTGNFLVTRQTL